MCGGAAVERLEVAKHAAVSGTRGRAAGRVSRDDDRNELACGPFGCDVDREFERHLARFLLVRHHGAVRTAWHADHRREAPAVFG